MLVVALCLAATGIFVGLLGIKLFRVLLPVFGLVSGAAVGFVGFQGVFGTGIASTSVAIFVAVIVGLLLALLSFLFFNLAITIYAAIVGATLLTYGGLALGLSENGFVMFVLAITGLIIGFSTANNYGFSDRVVIAVTSFGGAALVLAGIFLIAGDVTLNQLHEQGIIRSVLSEVNQSFLWIFAWLGGSLIAMQAQNRMLILDVLGNAYQFDVKRNNSLRKG